MKRPVLSAACIWRNWRPGEDGVYSMGYGIRAIRLQTFREAAATARCEETQ